MSTATIHRGKKTDGIKPPGLSATPRLLNGDHLTMPEFERRYEATPTVKRAELIEGIVVMSPPISYVHAESHSLLAEILMRYARETPGVACVANASVRLDGKNEYQPDVLLRIQSGNLAGTTVGADGLLEGSPELVAEIAVSSSAYDLHEKKTVYERCQVPEYLVWRVMDAQIQWFVLEQGAYLEVKPRADGVVCSRVFPGLWLNFHALLAGDEEKMLRTLEKGLKSLEHGAFVRKTGKR
jgi:Uma2 family endonuclease